MQYIADVVLASVILFNLIRGRRRGLVKTVFGLVSVVAAIILAYAFGSTAGKMLRETKAYEDLTLRTEKSLVQYIEKSVSEDSEKAYESITDTPFVKQLEALGIDAKKQLEEYSDSFKEGAEETAKEISKNLAQPLLEALSNAVGTVAVFFGAIVVFWILSKLLTTLCGLPFLRAVNKAGGTVLGFALGLIYAFVLCAVIKLIIPYVPQNPVIYPGMEKDTLLYGFFAGINPLYIFLIGKFMV